MGVRNVVVRVRGLMGLARARAVHLGLEVGSRGAGRWTSWLP